MATNTTANDLENYFQELQGLVDSEREPEERYLLNLRAENSDFIRFNKNQIRQAGQVRQLQASIDLIADSNHAIGSVALSGDLRQDWQPLNQLLNELRQQRTEVSADPYLYFATEPQTSRLVRSGQLCTAETAISNITQAAQTLDLVGIYASGNIAQGFSNHLGQNNWYQADSFNFDWSCYSSTDKAVKAVKARYSGSDWKNDEIHRCMQQVQKHLELVQRPAKTIAPGSYRAYLSPAALNEIIDLLGWGGFDLKSHRCHTSPLAKLARGERELNQQISLSENNLQGFAANFSPEGFLLPSQTTLIEAGQFKECLAPARQAREYSCEVNSRTGSPENLEMAAGQLAQKDILEALDEGLFIGNLWYLNYSDRNDCRITGMTRFGCFWVEKGKIVAPINVMRFDNSLYDILGAGLLHITQDRSLIMDANSYDWRSSASSRLPGVIIKDLTLTL